jgi:hypothetical protein
MKHVSFAPAVPCRIQHFVGCGLRTAIGCAPAGHLIVQREIVCSGAVVGRQLKSLHRTPAASAAMRVMHFDRLLKLTCFNE